MRDDSVIGEISNSVFSMFREWPWKWWCDCWEERADITTPEYADRKPYYNSTNSILVARSYLEYRRAVKQKAQSGFRRMKMSFPW